MTDSPKFEYPADPDYGIWTRAVERAVDYLQNEEEDAIIDYYPSEELVAGLVKELSDLEGYTLDPDDNRDFELVEDALIDTLS